MSEYRIENGTTFPNEKALKTHFKATANCSLKPFNENTMQHFGISVIFPTPKPQPSTLLKTVTRDGIELDSKDNWVQKWKEVDAFHDTEDATKEENEQAFLASELLKAKEAKLKEMKEARDKVVNGTTPITTSLSNTFTVDANISNRSTMHQAVTNSVNAGFTDSDSINWKMGDNTYALLSYGEMKEIGVQLGVFINTQFQKEAIKIGEINGATLDTINDISWD